MSESPIQELLRAFVGAWQERFPQPVGRADELAAALGNALERGRAAWPDLHVPPQAFATALAERADPGEAPLTLLARVHAADLYVVCGCLRGDERAVRALETHLVARVANELRRAGALTPYLDEAKQMLRVRLLVPPSPGERPRLDGYRARGPLAAWLRLTLTRLALNAREVAVRDIPLDRELVSGGAAMDDPELAFLRGHYQDELAAAMTEAFAAASSEERTILRMHFLDGLSADEVGSLFDVSGRTIQRRIVEARRQIVARTRAVLGGRLGMNPSQLDTLMRLCEGDLELSLRRILAPETD